MFPGTNWLVFVAVLIAIIVFVVFVIWASIVWTTLFNIRAQRRRQKNMFD